MEDRNGNPVASSEISPVRMTWTAGQGENRATQMQNADRNTHNSHSPTESRGRTSHFGGRAQVSALIFLTRPPSTSTHWVTVVRAHSSPLVDIYGLPVQEFLQSLCEPAENICPQKLLCQQLSKVFCLNVL